MTDLRTAAQQALEALGCIEYGINGIEYGPSDDTTESAITALRAALAQQTQTPCDIAEDGVCEVIDCCRNSAQILEALEIGYDSAQAEAAQYHAAMAGYRQERHAAMDADVAKIAAALTALRDALAQEEKAEPVLVVEKEPDYMSRGHFYEGSKPFIDPTLVWKLPIGTKLYTTPPRREWRGLTEEEINDGRNQLPTEDLCGWSFRQGVYFAEKALKERNNG